MLNPLIGELSSQNSKINNLFSKSSETSFEKKPDETPKNNAFLNFLNEKVDKLWQRKSQRDEKRDIRDTVQEKQENFSLDKIQNESINKKDSISQNIEEKTPKKNDTSLKSTSSKEKTSRKIDKESSKKKLSLEEKEKLAALLVSIEQNDPNFINNLKKELKINAKGLNDLFNQLSATPKGKLNQIFNKLLVNSSKSSTSNEIKSFFNEILKSAEEMSLSKATKLDPRIGNNFHKKSKTKVNEELKETKIQIKVSNSIEDNKEIKTNSHHQEIKNQQKSSLDLKNNNIQDKTKTSLINKISGENNGTNINKNNNSHIKSDLTNIGTLEGNSPNIKNASHLEKAFELPQTKFDPSKLIYKMAESIKHATANGKDFLSMKLNPANLGKMKIFLASDGDVFSAKILVDNVAIKELIETKMQDLKDHLQNKGLDFSNFTVDVGSGDTDQKSFSNSQETKNTSATNYLSENSINKAEEETIDLTTKESGINLVA